MSLRHCRGVCGTLLPGEFLLRVIDGGVTVGVGQGGGMDWARMLAYVTGTVDQELLARNEYLAAENRILKAR